jgi:hypothetical protein
MMKNFKDVFLCLAISSVFALAIIGCGGGGDDAAPSPISPSGIQPGAWIGSAGFGEFSFIVNSTSTGITEMSFKLSDFSCGPITLSVSSSTGRAPGLPITDMQFNIEHSFDFEKEETLTISGTFDETGKNATGTWEAVFYGTACSGTWDASFDGSDPEIDSDGDGYDITDCNDNDPDISIAVEEVCDGKDNNCDDVIDEGCGDDIDQGCQGGDLACLNGVWKIASSTEWDDDEGCRTDTFPMQIELSEEVGGGTATVSVYAKVSNNNTLNLYYKYSDSSNEVIPDGVYVCPENEENFTVDGNRIIYEEDVVNEQTFEISGNTLTLTDEVEQGCQGRAILTKVDESEIAGAIENCDAFPDDDGGGATTVTGTLTLPSEANGQEYWVLIDNDTNGDNGHIDATVGTCGSGTTVDYSLSNVPAGTYYVYAGVRVVSDFDSPPEDGDYFGFYGTGSIPPIAANAVVPALGTVTFDITLSLCCSW